MLEGSGLECDPTLPGLGWRRRTVLGLGLRLGVECLHDALAIGLCWVLLRC